MGQGRRPNFAGYSTPTRLTICDAGDTITVEGDTGTEGQMQATTYRIGADVAVPGPLGWDTRARAVRRDGALAVAVSRSIDGPSGTLRFEISDVYRVENGVLTLERSQGTRTQKTSYTRAAGQ